MALIGGTSGDDILVGTNEDDVILGYDSSDPDADVGDDLLFAGDGDDRLEGGGANDGLMGSFGDDRLEGGDGTDSLSGGDDNDLLLGGLGDDSISGDAGADVLRGGAGGDVFSWSLAGPFGPPFAPPDSTLIAQDRVMDFAGAGTPGSDTLLLLDAARDLVLEGALAAVPSIGSALPFGGNGFTEVFYAPDGADTVVFADSDDDGVFEADDFAARIDGRHNLVRADFGETAFVTRGTPDADRLAGGADDDEIFGLAGNDAIAGGGGRDRIEGGYGSDVLTGGAGDDFLLGNAGFDRLEGNAGDDRLAGGDGGDQAFGGAGDDTLDGDGGNDNLLGGVGEDVLFAGAGDDALLGGYNDDELFGDDGNDMLSGGEGADLLEGDAGADRLNGGGGDDVFQLFLGSFNASSDFVAPDRIVDFEGAGVAGGDELSLRSMRLVFRGEAEVEPTLGAALPGGGNGVTELVYTIQDGRTWLVADEDDDGVLDRDDFALQFHGELALTQGDFSSLTEFVTAGTPGDDSLAGGPRDDVIFGLAGDDSLFGRGGSDELDGGSGLDRLFGGGGGDTFIFAPGLERDRVVDFENGVDHLDLTGFGFDRFDEVKALAADTAGGDLRLELGGGDVLTVKDFELVDFTASDVLL